MAKFILKHPNYDVSRTWEIGLQHLLSALIYSLKASCGSAVRKQRRKEISSMAIKNGPRRTAETRIEQVDKWLIVLCKF